MSLLTAIPTGAVVGLDSVCLIYFLEAHSIYGPVVRPFFEQRVDLGTNRAVTSVVSLAEILVKPLRAGRHDLVQQHLDFLTTTAGLTLSDTTAAVAHRAAELRARYGIRLPDALHIASSIDSGASHFVTNDLGLRKVTELQVVVLQDFVPSSP
jgi:predicted nucleic acid-binding protein